MHDHFFKFSCTKGPQSNVFDVGIDSRLVNSLYQHALTAHREQFSAQGFVSGGVPYQYVERTCRHNILNHLKDLVFNHCVISGLCRGIAHYKIPMVSDPELFAIHLEPAEKSYYSFQFNTVDSEVFPDWKELPFRRPPRKNYRDLDRQAEAFITEECATTKCNEAIEEHDWVRFSIAIMVGKGQEKLPYCDVLWMKVDSSDISPVAMLFIGKKVGEICETEDEFFQLYINNKLSYQYHFLIEILAIEKNTRFSIDLFKKQFFLDHDEDVHDKYIEVLSTRNDISLRREIVTAALATLAQRSFLTIPHEFIKQEEEGVLAAFRHTPDYHIFRMRPDFKSMTHSLAEQQIKQRLIVDIVAFDDNIPLVLDDIRAYLNLFKRHRTRDFVFFTWPVSKINGQTIPLPEEYIKRFCMREKALNYIIHHLTLNNKN